MSAPLQKKKSHNGRFFFTRTPFNGWTRTSLPLQGSGFRELAYRKSYFQLIPLDERSFPEPEVGWALRQPGALQRTVSVQGWTWTYDESVEIHRNKRFLREKVLVHLPIAIFEYFYTALAGIADDINVAVTSPDWRANMTNSVTGRQSLRITTWPEWYCWTCKEKQSVLMSTASF